MRFTPEETLEVSLQRAAAQRSKASSPRAWETVAALFVLTAVFFWTFEADLWDLVRTWESQPDYSHGYLVPPLALLLLSARRQTYPGLRGPALAGLLLLAVVLAVRLAGQWLFLSPLQGWAMILWIGGACWALCGARCFLWISPSLAFLFFMVPLPFRAESWLSYPLQRMSTKASTWVFQLIGLPAIAQGNTILIEAQRFEIERACSGLRMLLGVGALAFAYAIVSRSSWLEKGMLFLCVVPVALAANCVRIVGTGLSCVYFPDEEAQRLAHDFSGWVVIPVAAAMLWLVMAFWRRLVIPLEPPSPAQLLRESELMREPTDAF